MPGTQTLLAERRSLLGDPRLRGRALARAHADLMDRWLGELLGDQEGVAVVAVGGYGRRQLCPASDLDVVLVHRGRRDVARLAESLWYPIWDAHLALDHSVRTVREALAVAGDDLKVALGLLDTRYVAGEADLAGDLVARVHQQWRRQAKRLLPVLDEACQERHRREGEVAFLLEPDLKAGRGGLRDLGALRAAGLGAPILPDPGADLDRAEATLVTARVELHRQAGRSLDRLLLQEQDGVARALDLPDSDALMAQVAEAARAVTWAGDDAWRRIRSWLAGPRG
ncbi:MAG TPA: hypothetical protein VE152_12875, partial [Acidimicrobiales bacterium]|nr:hypothetical protein [Acidimicrobiales bacterium]